MATHRDLELALSWCQEYEGVDAEDALRMERAVEFLRREIGKRAFRAATREVSRLANVDMSTARAELRKAMS